MIDALPSGPLSLSIQGEGTKALPASTKRSYLPSDDIRPCSSTKSGEYTILPLKTIA